MRRTFVVFVLILALGAGIAQSEQPQAQQNPQLVARVFALNIKPIEEVKDEARQEVADLGGYGPGSPLNLYEEVDINQLEYFSGLDLRDLCRYSLTVYPDVNEDSNIYYYRPHRYVLKFDPEDGGYFLRLDYKYGDSGARNVLMQARLTPGADRVDKEVLEAVLVSYLRAEGETNPNPKLLFLPATPEAEFDLTDWNIDQVTINGIDLDTGEIQLTLSADVPTKELVSNTISDRLGLTGSVHLSPMLISEEQLQVGRISLEANIRLADIASGPSMRFPSRGSLIEVENQWPFALELEHLVYLMPQSNGTLKLRGWELMDGEALFPSDQATLKLKDLNKEIRSSRAIAPMFIASLERDVDVGRSVIESVTGGVGALPIMQVTIDVVQPDTLYDQYDIYKIAVEMRSAHFDPEGRSIESRTYQVDDSGELVTSDPLYLWEDEGGGDVYQYRIGVVTADGVVHMDNRWRSPDSMLKDTIMIGTGVVEDVLAE